MIQSNPTRDTANLGVTKQNKYQLSKGSINQGQMQEGVVEFREEEGNVVQYIKFGNNVYHTRFSLFDGKSLPSALGSPDYQSDLITVTGYYITGVHDFMSIPSLIQLKFTPDNGNTYFSVHGEAGEATSIELTTTEWKLHGTSGNEWGKYNAGTGTTWTNIDNSGHFKLLLWK
tara:strand:+ start:15561 stop:16079 length:519 start_codon:yes stop_codon:yes gene_type:complete